MINSELIDVELTHLLKEGNHAAFAEIYDRHWGRLYIHALKMLKDENEAKDMVQEAFIGLWNNASALNVSSSLSAYLFSSMRNKVLNQIRNNRVRTGYIDLFSHYMDTHNQTVLERMEEKELLSAIEEVIQSLPEKMKEVFELSRKDHLSHKEIAEKLGISDKTVKRQISNALSILRIRLKKPENLILAVLLSQIKIK